MAKLKRAMRALEHTVTKNVIQNREIQELTAFMAVLVEQLGGTVKFTREDAEKLAGKKFDVSQKEGVITISLV